MARRSPAPLPVARGHIGVTSRSRFCSASGDSTPALELDRAAHSPGCSDPGCDHAEHAGHDHRFESWSYETDRPLSLDALRKVAAKLPANVYRAKGVVAASGGARAPRRCCRWWASGWTSPSTASGADRPPRTRIVAIGAAGTIGPGDLEKHFAARLAEGTGDGAAERVCAVLTRRIAAIAAPPLPPLMLVLAVVVMVQEFPRVLFVFGLLLVAIAAAWYGLLRRGAARAVGFAAGDSRARGDGDRAGEQRRPRRRRNRDRGRAGAGRRRGQGRDLLPRATPEAPAPKRAVLFYNPKSGGGRRRSSSSPKRPERGASSRSS